MLKLILTILFLTNITTKVKDLNPLFYFMPNTIELNKVFTGEKLSNSITLKNSTPLDVSDSGFFKMLTLSLNFESKGTIEKKLSVLTNVIIF
jgi:hypothetical protein